MEVYNNNPGGGYLPRPKTWFVEAILTLLFCCLPFGIVAIVYASQVSSHYSCGRYAESQEASRNARKWVMVAFFCGLAIYLLYGAIYAIFGLSLLGACLV